MDWNRVVNEKNRDPKNQNQKKQNCRNLSGISRKYRRKTGLRRKKIAVYSCVLSLILIVIIAMSQSISTKATEQRPDGVKRYESIMIQEGDSLWSIAKEYKLDEISIAEYINDVKKINRLYSDRIHAGNYLIVYYYEMV